MRKSVDALYCNDCEICWYVGKVLRRGIPVLICSRNPDIWSIFQLLWDEGRASPQVLGRPGHPGPVAGLCPAPGQTGPAFNRQEGTGTIGHRLNSWPVFAQQNYTKNCLTKSFKMTFKNRLLLIFQFYFHLMNLYISEAFLPPGSRSASLHADPDPGSLHADPCGSGSATLGTATS